MAETFFSLLACVLFFASIAAFCVAFWLLMQHSSGGGIWFGAVITAVGLLFLYLGSAAWDIGEEVERYGSLSAIPPDPQMKPITGNH